MQYVVVKVRVFVKAYENGRSDALRSPKAFNSASLGGRRAGLGLRRLPNASTSHRLNACIKSFFNTHQLPSSRRPFRSLNLWRCRRRNRAVAAAEAQAGLERTLLVAALAPTRVQRPPRRPPERYARAQPFGSPVQALLWPERPSPRFRKLMLHFILLAAAAARLYLFLLLGPRRPPTRSLHVSAAPAATLAGFGRSGAHNAELCMRRLLITLLSTSLRRPAPRAKARPHATRRLPRTTAAARRARAAPEAARRASIQAAAALPARPTSRPRPRSPRGLASS